ncbi:hypothetical protein Avbf_14795 [Armadillidium vulgare]|nr:hypothetical protein Avbf_14795 [Armadillidium vulgare]
MQQHYNRKPNKQGGTYQPPSRCQLSEGLLDEVAGECELRMVGLLRGKQVTMIQDGWSNVHNHPVIATCLHLTTSGDGGKKSIFAGSIDTGAEKKTANYISDLAIKQIGQFEDIQMQGCSLHFGQRKQNEADKTTSRDPLQRGGRKRAQFRPSSGWVREKGGKKPQLPNDTRWNSQCACVDTFIQNFQLYIEIRNKHSAEIANNIAAIIDNVAIHREAMNLQNQLNIVASALDRLQSDFAHWEMQSKYGLRFLKTQYYNHTKLSFKQDLMTGSCHFN